MYSSPGREALIDHFRSVASMSIKTVEGSAMQSFLPNPPGNANAIPGTLEDLFNC
jgi:hypothetical protein